MHVLRDVPGDGSVLRDLEGVLGPEVVKFVEERIASLLAWDIVVFFHRHPADVLDIETLASRLGRGPAEISPEVETLCGAGILETAGGLVRYRPTSAQIGVIDAFVEACQNRNHRLALIALVLQKINPHLDS